MLCCSYQIEKGLSDSGQIFQRVGLTRWKRRMGIYRSSIHV